MPINPSNPLKDGVQGQPELSKTQLTTKEGKTTSKQKKQKLNLLEFDSFKQK